MMGHLFLHDIRYAYWHAAVDVVSKDVERISQDALLADGKRGSRRLRVNRIRLDG